MAQKETNKPAKKSVQDPFSPVTKTKMMIKAYGTGADTEAYIEGFTPDSKEWRDAVRRNASEGQKDQRLYLSKNGSYINLKSKFGEYSDEDLMLVEMITDIQGIPGYVFSKESVGNLLLEDKYFILRQWRSHMDDEKNFLEDPC